MSRNFLLIVEGEKTEKRLFGEILSRYGFHVIDIKKRKFGDDQSIEFLTSELVDGVCNVVIAQGPKNRIRDFIKLFDTRTSDIEKVFSDSRTKFSAIFIIYDVDHTSIDDLNSMFDKFNDETSGLLLLSSPCIEVLSDIDSSGNVFSGNRIREYKTLMNEHCNKNLKYYNSLDFIIANFEKCVLYYLDKNVSEFQEYNIMEHPQLVKDMINKINVRKYISKYNHPVIYRYFTTVVYVCIAYIKGLTKEIDNYEIVRVFFENQMKRRILGEKVNEKVKI